MYWPFLNMYWENSGVGLGGFNSGGALINAGGDYIYIYMYIYTYNMHNPSTGSINGTTIQDFFGRMSPRNTT